MVQDFQVAHREAHAPWMLGSPKSDILWFYVAPLIVGVILFAMAESNFVTQSLILTSIAVNGFGFGPLHQGATWFSYFDKANREYYASSPLNRAVFLAGPPFLILVCTLCAFLSFEATVFVFVLWHVHHLIQQNVRFLALHHREPAKYAISNNDVEIATQWLGAMLFTLIGFHRVDMFGCRVMPLFEPALIILAVLFVVTGGVYICDIMAQMRDGKSCNVPALTFWIVSVLSMAPVAFFGKSYYNAFLLPLALHWFQFIGFNAHIVRNKYVGEKAERLPFGSPSALFFGTCVCFMLISVSLQAVSSGGIFSNVWVGYIGIGIVFGLAACHYILDTFLWRFNEPFQQEQTIPYLFDEGRTRIRQ